MTWYPDLTEEENTDPEWPIYGRLLVSHIPSIQRPWFAACRIVNEIWRKHAPTRLNNGDVQTYRESLQRLCLDIEVGRAELAYERSLMS